ncbi:hypothetical protein IGI04_002233, partial [Brassica rapa subsp. trilocularis]
MHAVGVELKCVAFTEENVCVAAENYLIETLALCQSGALTQDVYYHLNYLRVVVMFYVVTPTLCIFFLFVAYTRRMKSYSIC